MPQHFELQNIWIKVDIFIFLSLWFRHNTTTITTRELKLCWVLIHFFVCWQRREIYRVCQGCTLNLGKCKLIFQSQLFEVSSFFEAARTIFLSLKLNLHNKVKPEYTKSLIWLQDCYQTFWTIDRSHAFKEKFQTYPFQIFMFVLAKAFCLLNMLILSKLDFARD
jgi:hypothetical protein